MKKFLPGLGLIVIALLAGCCCPSNNGMGGTSDEYNQNSSYQYGNGHYYNGQYYRDHVSMDATYGTSSQFGPNGAATGKNNTGWPLAPGPSR